MGKIFGCKILSSAAVAALLLVMPLVLWALDQPHDTTSGHNISCDNCHLTAGSVAPRWLAPSGGVDDTLSNRKCMQCHDGVAAVAVATHSSSTTQSAKWDAEGGFTAECVHCHNPHYQRQSRVYGTAAYLLPATPAVTVVSLGSYNEAGNTTTLTLSGSGLPAEYKGYYLVPNTAYRMFSYKIMSATLGQTAIDIAGKVNAAYASPGKTAQIVYSKNVNDIISYTNPGGTAVGGSVRMFRPGGTHGPADAGNMATSLCAVCHSLTAHYNAAGSGDATHNAGATCTTCHPHALGFRPACNGCHEYPPPTNAHKIHVTTLKYACKECHFGNSHNPSNIASNPSRFLLDYDRSLVDIGFDPNGFNSDTNNGTVLGLPVFTRNGSSALSTCANLTCHNPDNKFTGKGVASSTNNIPAWGSVITTCTACHTTTGAADGGRNSHGRHANSTYSWSVDCTGCHAEVNVVDPETKGTDPRHANKVLNIDQDGNYPVHVNASLPYRTGITATYTDGLPGTTTGSTCKDVYCHGGFQTNTGNNYTFTWGVTDVDGGGNCYYCHKFGSNFSGTTNKSHIAHLDGAGTSYKNGPQLDQYSCGTCHASGGGGPLHADGRVSLTGADDGTLANTTACDRCHGTAAGIAEAKTNWPLNVSTSRHRISDCSYCHNSATPGNSKVDGTGVNAPAKDSYYITGHGKSGTFNATNNAGPGYACTICHDQDSKHIDHVPGTGLRFRSVPDDGLDYTSASTEVCLDCHKPGQALGGALGKDALSEASVHSGAISDSYNTASASAFPAYGDKGNYRVSPGYQCADCHDSHGTGKLAMVRPTLNGRVGGAGNPVAVAGFESTDTDFRDLAPDAVPGSGVCGTCHSQSGASHPDTAHPNNHHQGESGKSCMNCHSHKYSFGISGPLTRIIDPTGDASDKNVDFGSVVATTQKDLTLTVRNAGRADLVLGVISSGNPLTTPFSIVNDTCSGRTLAPAAACTFAVRFAPAGTGVFTDSFDLSGNDPSSPATINLSGIATAVGPDITVTDSVVPVEDLSLPFGEQLVSSATDQTVTITNNGVTDLTLGTIASADPLAAPFSIINNTCTPGLKLIPGAACTFNVHFAPVAKGTFSDHFDIPSDDPDENPVIVNVSGTALLPVYAYVMSQGNALNSYVGAVTKIRTFDNQVVQTLPTTTNHKHTYVAVTPDGSKIYTNYSGSDILRIYNPSLVAQSVTLSATTSSMHEATSQGGAYVYSIISSDSDVYANYVAVIDTANNTVISQTPLDRVYYLYISGLAVSPDGAYIYVPINITGGAHYVSVLRTLDMSVAATLTLDSPYGIAFSPDSSKAYIVNNTGGTVSVIRTSDFTVTGTIGVGPGPKGIVASPDGAKLYVVNESDNTISVIETASGTVSMTIEVMPSSGNLGSISITPDGKRLYITVPAADQVMVVRTDYNVPDGAVAVARSPYSYGNCIQSNDPNLDQPDISLTDTSAPAGDHGVNFGNVTVAQVSTVQTITVTNTGTANLVLGSIAVQDPVSAPFSITSNTCSSQTLVPAAACTIGVRYSPTAAGAVYDTFDIPSNDPNEQVVRVTLKGTGTDPDIAVTDAVAPADDSLLPFGNQVVNTTASRILTVRNNGVGNLVFGNITAAAPFSVDLATSTCDNYGATGMATGSTCTIYVQFTPTAQTVYTGSVSISSNDPGKSPFTVTVTGTGTAPAPDITLTDQNSSSAPPVTALDFGYLDYHGGFLSKTLYIRNDGSAILNIGTISLPAGPFTVENTTCGTLNPADICYITLKCAPSAGVAYEAYLSIASNDPDENPATLTLTGHGFETYLAYVTNSFYKDPDSVCRFPVCTNANTVSAIYLGANAVTGGLSGANFGNAAVWDGVLNSNSSPFGVAATDSRIYITASGYGQVWHIPAKNTWTFSSAGKINVGRGPAGIVASPDGKRLYVTNAVDNTVSVIDRAAHTVTATITVDSSPRGVDVTPDNGYVYVANTGSNTVSVIRTADNAVVKTVPVGTAPFGVAVSPDGLTVLVTNYSSNTVSVIETATNTVTRTIAAGTTPYGIAFTPDGNFAYVANTTTATVTVIETAGGTVAATINVAGAIASYPAGIAATPDGRYIYVVNSAGTSSSTSLPGWITAIRTSDNTVAGTVSTDKGAAGFGKFIISYHTPNIQVSSQNISFGHAVPGNSAAQTITITNTGPANTNLLIGTIGTVNPLAAPFTLANDTCSTRTLASGAFCTFDVRFSPAAPGSFTDSFAIPNNDPESNPVTVTLGGTGNNPPNTPVNASPDAGATGVALSPTLIASAFSDVDAGDIHLASQWRVSTASGASFDASVVYDSGVTGAGNSHTVSATANFGTTYYWKVRYQDSQGDWSAYSGETAFTTLTNATPGKPLNISPAPGAVDIVRKPALTASAFFDGDAGDTHKASQWRISRATGASFDANVIYDSGTVAGSASHVVTANLPVNTFCYWKVRYQDSKGVWSAYSDETSFTTTKLISQWHLDEGTGTTTADSSGGNNGGITGTGYWSAGYTGNGLSCSGDDKLSWTYAEGRPSNNFTLEAMVHVTAVHEIDTESAAIIGGISGQKYLFGANYYNSPDAGMGVSVGTNGISVYEHSGSYMPALAVYDATLTPLSGWNHIVVTYTDKQPRIYLNGTLVRTGLVSSRTNVYISTSLCVDDSSYGAFSGSADEVRIYGSALSGAEVLARCQAIGRCL
ncbi:MAG: CxxxxCH/CxxCH domain-containing protein [Nitrospiraceae bacterium]|nr:CxxxxCH/CxxCH domain-containing protein [Nitrospiraceae bacterium]